MIRIRALILFLALISTGYSSPEIVTPADAKKLQQDFFEQKESLVQQIKEMETALKDARKKQQFIENKVELYPKVIANVVAENKKLLNDKTELLSTLENLEREKEAFENKSQSLENTISSLEEQLVQYRTIDTEPCKKVELLQEEFNNQKEHLRSQMKLMSEQLHETREQQERIEQEIARCSALIVEIANENKDLVTENSRLAHSLRDTSDQNKKLADKNNALEEQLSNTLTTEAEFQKKKAEYKAQSSLEIHRLKRTIMSLQEKIDDSSWADAIDKHMFKLASSFAVGCLVTYLITSGTAAAAPQA